MIKNNLSVNAYVYEWVVGLKNGKFKNMIIKFE